MPGSIGRGVPAALHESDQCLPHRPGSPSLPCRFIHSTEALKRSRAAWSKKVHAITRSQAGSPAAVQPKVDDPAKHTVRCKQVAFGDLPVTQTGSDCQAVLIASFQSAIAIAWSLSDSSSFTDQTADESAVNLRHDVTSGRPDHSTHSRGWSRLDRRVDQVVTTSAGDGGTGGAGPVTGSGLFERHHARQQRLRGWPRLGSGDGAEPAQGGCDRSDPVGGVSAFLTRP